MSSLWPPNIYSVVNERNTVAESLLELRPTGAFEQVTCIQNLSAPLADNPIAFLKIDVGQEPNESKQNHIGTDT